MALAAIVYGAVGALLVGATATARQMVEEKLTQVEFAAPPPEPPPPPPVADPTPQPKSLRPKAKRAVLTTPDKVPDEKLKESNAELAKGGDVGPVDGFLDGTPGGTGNGRPAPPPPPPPPVRAEPLVQPVELGGNPAPQYSGLAKRNGVEGTVVVTFDVLENGTVANARIVSGPEALHESVLRAVARWRFKPAHRGAELVRYKMTRRIVFRLEDE
jgi:protein TonB